MNVNLKEEAAQMWMKEFEGQMPVNIDVNTRKMVILAMERFALKQLEAYILNED